MMSGTRRVMSGWVIYDARHIDNDLPDTSGELRQGGLRRVLVAIGASVRAFRLRSDAARAFSTAPMKLLVTNDDGIDAPGLQALYNAAEEVGEPVIVAPAGPQSGVSHAVTFERPLRMEPRGDRHAVHGTPADCTRLGLLKIEPQAKWILSGINNGGNLGADVYYSGTVAAVREGILHGWPGIAFSQYRKRGLEVDWHRATRWIVPVLKDLMSRPVEPGLFYNVNLPHLTSDEPDPEVVFCPLDPRPLPLSYRHEENEGLFYDGDYQARERIPGADVDVCFRGRIAVTAIRLF